MAFWSSETLKRRIIDESLVEPLDESQIKNARYQLKVGDEVYVTSNEVKQTLGEREQFCILPGQFAIILTEESVTVPSDSIAFISMRYGIKLNGLVNVSGFHVDPGFVGKLKFCVYNAGSKSVVLTRGEPAFLIWYCNLDGVTDIYQGDHKNQMQISSLDVNQTHGEKLTPVELKEKFDEKTHSIELRLTTVENNLTILRNTAITVFVALAFIIFKDFRDNNHKTEKNTLTNIQSQISSALQKKTISTNKSPTR